MKSLKAAAVVAGSLVVAGAAAPAFAAHSPADLTPTSLNGAVNTLASGNFTADDALPLQHQSQALDTENKDSVLNTVNGVTTALNQGGGLLGGLPLPS
ncbi:MULTISPECIES: hypothetical protein [Streptomyces]|uniref:Secreted protein n=1 Tax=Streptomyces fuscus TaxID=3048495 RepID=A0ABT7IVA2_9ACTN|nr:MULTISPECIES: hypothetical protein [Streptomyces]MCM1975903.1 hypothetical protein [Streptomyces sp. G1]MDL2076518.1 hypothetical protein [Streptomyces fuscus]SBT92717.1 hypothetical protein GA0115233_104952 [Streptomyces sp. DI166]